MTAGLPRILKSLSIQNWVDRIVDRLDQGVSVVGSANTLSYMVNDILASTPWIDFKHPTELSPKQREWLFEVTAELSRAYLCLPPFTDVLGPVYMQYASRHAKCGLGQFFTPSNLSDLMTEMVYSQHLQNSNGGVIRFNEPSVGSGSMPLAFCRHMLRTQPNDLIRLHCHMGDLDILCCKMTAVQFVMNFVAFNLSPIAGFIYQGDSLGKPSLYISWDCDLEPAQQA